MADKDDVALDDLEKQVDELSTQLAEAVAKAETAGKEQIEALQKQLDERNAEVEKMKKEQEELVLKASMTSDEKDHCDDMKPDERSAFMAKAPDERKAAMKKRADDDEIIKIEGQEIRKSVVGEAQFAIMKAQDARIRKQDEDIAKERDARVQAELEKRADDEFPHVPGEVKERAAMLKAMDGMSESLRKSFEAVFTQSEKLAKSSFEKVGHGGGTDDLEKRGKKAGPSAFEKRVEEIAKTFKMTKTEAMSKARRDYPEDYQKYQEGN